MTHPYENVPDYQLHRLAVARNDAATFDPVVAPKFTFNAETPIATMGSCFAQNLSKWLLDSGCNFFRTEPTPDDAGGIFSANFGNVYTVAQALQLYKYAFGQAKPSDEVWTAGGRFVDPLRPGPTTAGFDSEAAALEARKTHYAAVREMFEKAAVLVFTLGLTETWRRRSDGAILPLAPGVAGGTYVPQDYKFSNFSFEETKRDLEELVSCVTQTNPAIKIILTVSPVPLAATFEHRHVSVSSTASKAILRAAADAVVRTHDNVDYFPSYEIFFTPGIGDGYFQVDGRHVANPGVAHAMRIFARHYLQSSHPQKDQGVYDRAWCDEETITKATSRGNTDAGRTGHKPRVIGQRAERHPHPYIGFRGTPNGIVDNDDTVEQGPVKLDSAGYWNPRDLQAFMGPEYRRIAVIGSSAIADYKLPYSQNISGVLERYFHDAGHTDVIVANCGIPSSVAMQDFANLAHHALRLQPSAIVVFTGGNDLRAALEGDPRAGNPVNHYFWEMVLANTSLKQSKIMLENVDFDIDALRDSVRFTSSAWTKAIYENYQYAATRMIDLCRGAGVPLLLINQPTAASYRLGQDVETSAAEENFRTDAGARSVLFAKKIQPLAEPGKIVVQDWTAMFDAEATRGSVYVDRMHMTAHGYDVIARAMFAQIQANFKI